MNLEEKRILSSKLIIVRKPLLYHTYYGSFRRIWCTSFYHGKIGSAIGLLILTLLTVWFTFGILTAVWVIIDAF